FTDNIKCDVRYTFKLAGLEQDLIVLSQIPSPEAYGLDPNTSRLESWTEFDEAPDPIISTRLLQSEADPQNQMDPHFSDDTLNFGIMTIGNGTAFSLQDTPADSFDSAINVAKT